MALSVSGSHPPGALSVKGASVPSPALWQRGSVAAFPALFLIVPRARGQQCISCILSGALWGLAQCSAWNHGLGKAWWWVMSHRNLKIPSPPLSGCAWPQLMPIQSWLPVHGSKASLFGAPLKEP